MLAAPAALASPPGNDSLDTIMVTATRTERKKVDVPASTSVITAEEIRQSPAQSADELLSDVVGVDVRHGIGVLSTSTSNKVTMRGLAGTTEGRTLLLIDGVPANDIYGGAIEWNEIPLDDIERIEIVRGASSALYGSNAMGGVINIITRSPEKGFQARGSLGVQSMNTREFAAGIDGSKGSVAARLSGRILRSDGYLPLAPADRKPTSIDHGMERENVSARVDWAPVDGTTFSLGGRHFHEQKTGTLDYPGYNPFEQEQSTVNLDWEQTLPNAANLSASLWAKTSEGSYDSADYLTGYTSTAYTNTSEETSAGGTIKYTMPLITDTVGDHVLTAGIDFRDGEITRRNDYQSGRNIRVEGSQQYAGLFLQDELFLMEDRLVLNIGGRFDYWNSYDGLGYDDDASPSTTRYDDADHTAFNPKLGAVWHVTESTSLRASTGKAFRAPTLSDLYNTWVWGTRVYAGNPDLGPEEVTSWELGLDQAIGERTDMSVSLYYNDAQDFIAYLTPDPAGNPDYHEKENVGEVSTRGVEIELSHRIDRHWRIGANYTWNRSEIEAYAADPSIEGNLLPDAPEHKAAVNLAWTGSDFSARAVGRHVGSRYSDDTNLTEYSAYTVFNLGLRKRLGEHWRVSLDVQDLFDRGYQEHYVSPGRTVMARLTAEL